MKEYVYRRLTLLQGLSLVLLGFSLAVGGFLVGIICLVVAVLLDALNAWLLSRKPT